MFQLFSGKVLKSGMDYELRCCLSINIMAALKSFKDLMLILKCAACKKKLWRYDKIGPGSVLRCHKNRITKIFQFKMKDSKVVCHCGREIGIDKGSFYKMIARSFTHSGTKRN